MYYYDTILAIKIVISVIISVQFYYTEMLYWCDTNSIF